MTKAFHDFYFRQWQVAFFSALSPKSLYKDTLLAEKLKQHLFFYTLELENKPFYSYWDLTSNFLNHYPKVADVEIFERDEASFLRNKEKYLKLQLKAFFLIQWLFIPELLEDLYKYYPLFKDLHFAEEEFLYLDFWSKIPYVMTTAFEDLTLLGYSTEILTEKSLSSFIPKKVYSDETVADYTLEELSQHLVKYFVEEASDNYFSKILELYIEARPSIKQDITASLIGKGIEVTNITMVQEFLGVTLLKGVSLKAQRFCVANMDLTNKDFTKVTRLEWKDYWDKLTVEDQKAIIAKAQRNYDSAKEYLEAQNKRSEIEKNLEVAEYFYKINALTDVVSDKELDLLASELIPKGFRLLPGDIQIWQQDRWLKEFISIRTIKK